MNTTEWIVLCAYASLVIELTVFPIPSEASTLQLFGQAKSSESPLARTHDWSAIRKVICLLLPTAMGVVLFLLPLVSMLKLGINDYLFWMTLPQLETVGVILVLCGRVLTFWSVLQLRRAKGRSTIPAGLFRYSRNPGLVGMYSFYLGLCVIFGGPWLWLGVPLYIGNMHYRVRLEEAALQVRHGANWSAYADRVARYLPLPGLR
jgi:protein-S-isoprenylcysteine O-methyltransferase Ste14